MSVSTKRATMITVSLALFMDVLDTNIINTAIPTMAENFKVNPVDLKIALISYLLSIAVFIPISGWTADTFGTKRIFLGALSLFTISSFWCGYAHSLMDLVIARSIQGIGGAFMLSLGRLIIVRTFERHKLVEAMNKVIIMVSLAVMLGPFIGGFITEHFSWPWIFWLNIPVGILAIVVGFFGLKDTAPKKSRPFDVKGFVLFGGSLSLLCFALSELSESKVSLHSIVYMLMISLCMFITYFIHARFYKYPVINISLFKFRTFRISIFGNLCTRLGFGGMAFLLPLLFQINLKFSAQASGLLLVSSAFGIIFSKLMASKILRLMGYRRYLLMNTFMMGLVLALFLLINTHTSVYTIIFLNFLFGMFMASQFTAMNSLAFAEISEEDLSSATTITSTTQILAQTLGVAYSAILLRYFSYRASMTGVLSVEVFHNAFLAMSVVTLGSIMLFLYLKTDDGQQMLVKAMD